MSSFKAKIAAVATFAAASGTALLMTAGAASAAATVPASAITQDPNASNGTVSFYDATGAQVTSGNNLNHLFDYAYASTAATRTPSTKATMYFSFPDHTQSDSQNWVQQNASSSTNYPNNGAATPASVKGKPNPLVTLPVADANYNAAAAGVTLDTTNGYAGIVQVRVYDSGPGVPITPPFWASDLYIDTTANTWTQVYPVPAPKVTPAISAITATPASPAAATTTSASLSASLTTSDGSKPAGTVELFNGSADLGPATYTASSGAVSATATVASGSYAFKFVFTPTDTSAYNGASSPVLNYTVKGAAQNTTTALTGPATGNTGDTLSYTAAVAQGASALAAGTGSVQFSTDGGTTYGSAVALDSTGKATFSYFAAAAGQVSVIAKFTPADPSTYNASTSNTVVTTIAAAAYNPDPQNVTVTVPKGTLVISTPYTAANPFKLGTMVLNASGTQYSASAQFGDPAAPAATDPGTSSSSNGVTITDTRAGSTGWTASAQTTDFTNGNATPIDGNNLSFTGIVPKYLTGNHLQAGSVATNDITAFKTIKKSFATTTQGPGTVNLTGTLSLVAPTSTLPGDYTATVTFTIA